MLQAQLAMAARAQPQAASATRYLPAAQVAMVFHQHNQVVVEAVRDLVEQVARAQARQQARERPQAGVMAAPGFQLQTRATMEVILVVEDRAGCLAPGRIVQVVMEQPGE